MGENHIDWRMPLLVPTQNGAMQGYVFTPNYVGRDRRVDARKRLMERRHVDAAKLAPSVHAALRQLCMRAIELDSESTASAFLERLHATQALAEARCSHRVADRLRELAVVLARGVSGSKSDLAEVYLRQATYALAATG